MPPIFIREEAYYRDVSNFIGDLMMRKNVEAERELRDRLMEDARDVQAEQYARSKEGLIAADEEKDYDALRKDEKYI